jgi:osmotically-inducible protein OsmY
MKKAGIGTITAAIIALVIVLQPALVQSQTASAPDQKLAAEVLNRIKNKTLYGIFDWVTVTSDRGVVTLSGWAALPWHKRQFEHQAKQMSGVARVINNVQIESQMISDDEIRSTVSRLIYSDLSYRPFSRQPGWPVHIVVNYGNVYLEGSVDTQPMSDRAEQAAYAAANAFNIMNNIHVEAQ